MSRYCPGLRIRRTGEKALNCAADRGATEPSISGDEVEKLTVGITEQHRSASMALASSLARFRNGGASVEAGALRIITGSCSGARGPEISDHAGTSLGPPVTIRIRPTAIFPKKPKSSSGKISA
jgi:hypothetical protein